MSLTLVRSRSIRYRDGIFSRGRERRSRARSLLEQDLTKKKKVLVHGAKFSSVTARRDKYVNFYKRQGRGEEVYLKLQVLFQKMFEKRG